MLKENHPPLRAGDTWQCVTARGQGKPVKIRRVTPVNVQFQAIGGRDKDDIHSIAHDVFLSRYVPLSLVVDRQREMRIEEMRGEGPVLVPPPAPLVPPEPTPIRITEAISQLQRVADRRPGPHSGPTAPRLTGEQAVEVYQLAWDGSTPAPVIAEAYGITESTVSDVKHQRVYAWATAGVLRPLKDLVELPTIGYTVTEQEVTVAGEKADYVKIAAEAQQMLRDMADAIEFLVDRAEGKPLSRFVTIDLAAIRQVAVDGRRLAQS